MRRVGFIVAATLIMFAVAIGFWLSTRDGTDVEAALQAWREIGGATSPAELVSVVPDAKNAARFYSAAYDALVASAPGAGELLEVWADPVDGAAALIDSTANVRAMIDDAAAFEACVWDTGCAAAPGADISYLAEARLVARYLAVHAVLSSRRGDIAGAAVSIERLLCLSDHLAAVPATLHLMTSLAIESLAFDVLLSTFRDRELPAGRLADRDRDYTSELRAALLAEGACGLSVFATPPFAARYTFPGWSLDRDRAIYIRTMTAAVMACKEPLRAQSLDSDDVPGRAILSNMLIPALDGLRRLVLTEEARQVMFTTALELRAERERAGAYPDLFPMPLDPLTGQPLQYEALGQGFRIRSSDPALELAWEWD